MKLRLSAFICLTLGIFSCEFNKSSSKDLITGLTTKGNGLSCKEVYLSDGENEIRRNSFTFGETFYLNFQDIKGFEKEGEYVFPGLQVVITGETGDTLLQQADLFADRTNGLNISPLLLKANITAGSPIYSNKNYKLHVNIWDKKGSGTYKAQMNFDVKPGSLIRINKNDISYDEIYLYAEKSVLTDNQVKPNTKIYMAFEGLQGFHEEAGKVFPGLSMKSMDVEGNVIFNNADMVGESGMDVANFQQRITPNIKFPNTNIKNPVTLEIRIWDKKSDRSIEASSELYVQ